MWLTPNNLSLIRVNFPDKSNARSATMLGQHSRLHVTFRRLEVQVGELLKKRAYLHYYLQEGMEEDEFTEFVDNMKDMVTLYEEEEKEFGD